jgi:hypothetical protein
MEVSPQNPEEEELNADKRGCSNQLQRAEQ